MHAARSSCLRVLFAGGESSKHVVGKTHSIAGVATSGVASSTYAQRAHQEPSTQKLCFTHALPSPKVLLQVEVLVVHGIVVELRVGHG